MADDETRVRELIEAWATATSSEDRAGILAHHSVDLLMFDFPSTVRGIDAYSETWEFFFHNTKGPITFAPRELVVAAGDDVAFAACMIRCEGTSAGPLDLRLTTGLKKIDGDWVITHEHHSVPTVEERFIDPSPAPS